METSRLTRDGTAEPVSRDHILRHARGQGNIIFPVQLTTSRIGNLTRLIHTLLYVMTIHNVPIVGVGKVDAQKLFHGVSWIDRGINSAPVTRATFRITGLVPADSRRQTPSVRICMTHKLGTDPIAVDSWRNPASKHQISTGVCTMNGLTRDGMAKPVSRDQILVRRERGHKINFPCWADHYLSPILIAGLPMIPSVLNVMIMLGSYDKKEYRKRSDPPFYPEWRCFVNRYMYGIGVLLSIALQTQFALLCIVNRETLHVKIGLFWLSCL